jgi:hypothetical protein
MLAALFATPIGQKTRYMRVRRAAREASAITHLLAEHGFTPTRESHNETWFVRVGERPPRRGRAVSGAVVSTEGLPPSTRVH